MKKSLKLLGVTAVFMLSLGAVVSCGGEGGEEKPAELVNVRVGLQGNMGSSAGFLGIENKLFEKAGVNVEKSVTGGPNIITGLKGGTLDIGMLGNGVSWNYFHTDASIKLLTLENLTDDDRLIATKTGKGKNLSINSTLDELTAALANSTVALDIAKTPGSFLQSIITKLNTGRTAETSLWYQDSGTSSVFPTDSTKPASYKINVISTDNANILAAMTGAEAPDFCVAYSPVSSKLEKDTEKFTTVAKSSTHLADALTPSTWAVSSKFLKENPETVQKFMNGLMESFDLRHDNINLAAAATANQLKSDVTDFPTGIAYWPSSADLKTWFSTETGDGWKYVEQIRNSQLKSANLTGVTPLSAKDASDVSYLLKACDYAANLK